MTKRNAIIVDIDGTIADATHRLPLIKGGNRDWDAFFDAMVNDPYIEGSWETIIAETAKYAEEFPFVVFLTGRRDSHLMETVEWLKKYIPLEHGREYTVLMRPTGDTREDTILKKEIYETLVAKHLNVLVAFEDRPRIIEMWQSCGLPTFKMGEWKDFEHAAQT